MSNELDAVTKAIDDLTASFAAEIQRVADNLSKALATSQATVPATADLNDEITAAVGRLTALRAQVDAVDSADVAAGNAPVITVDTPAVSVNDAAAGS